MIRELFENHFPKGLIPNLPRLSRLIRKELAEVLRDRRTILTLILMPVLLYPLLTIGFQQYLVGQRLGSGYLRYQIGFRNRSEANHIMSYFRTGRDALRREGMLRSAGTSRPGDPGNASAPHVIVEPDLEVFVDPEASYSLMKGMYDVVVIYRSEAPLRRSPDEDLAQDWAILYREDSALGLDAMHYLGRLTSAANQDFLVGRLQAQGVTGQRTEPIRILPRAAQEIGPKKPGTFAVLVPLVLILMTITGAVYPAIDVTAGERERGTLEVLVAAPIPRLSVLFAKYIAVLTVAMLTAGINLLTMTISLMVSGIGPALFAGQFLGPQVFLQIVALLFLFAIFFSAVLLALTSFARSFKEAQAYLIPLMLVSMVPGMIGLLPGLRLEGLLAVVPLLNGVLLARDLIAGNASPVMATVVVLTTLIYALLALSLAARIFGAEAVLYSQSSSWSDILRRPKQPRDYPDASSALLCLAWMFPTYFLLTYSRVHLPELPVEALLMVSVLANIILFLFFPGTSLWLGRVRPWTAFALRRPPLASLLPALVLGLSLWPWTHEITALLRALGVDTIRSEHLESVRDALKKWREVSPFFIITVLAIITPMLEELFFRGYLQGALLRAQPPAAAILTSAALFGAFHLFTSFGIAVERFVPTTLMGIALGWVRYRAGSIWPGVLLHGAHNGLVVMLIYWQPYLEAAGFIQQNVEFLPWHWLAMSLIVATLGWWLMLRTTRAAGPAAAGTLPA